MKIMDYFYTEKDAAKLLGVNPITIWRWVKDGKLDLQHVGREALIPKWEVETLRVVRGQEALNLANRKRCKDTNDCDSIGHSRRSFGDNGI